MWSDPYPLYAYLIKSILKSSYAFCWHVSIVFTVSLSDEDFETTNLKISIPIFLEPKRHTTHDLCVVRGVGQRRAVKTVHGGHTSRIYKESGAFQ
jgi:hypothetical protein